jgi:hypothetical protein
MAGSGHSAVRPNPALADGTRAPRLMPAVGHVNKHLPWKVRLSSSLVLVLFNLSLFFAHGVVLCPTSKSTHRDFSSQLAWL